MSDYLGSGWKGYDSYESEQADIHFANTVISSWRNCPCDSCRERQAADGYPVARFSNEPDPAAPVEFIAPADYDAEPPF